MADDLDRQSELDFSNDLSSLKEDKQIEEKKEQVKKKTDNKILMNPIEEYVKNNSDKSSTFQDLFEANEQNVDLRTDLTIQEIIIINKIKMNCEFLERKIAFPIYHEFVNSYLRLKISMDRKSRAEFVDVNRRERFEQNLQRFGNFQKLSEVKK